MKKHFLRIACLALILPCLFFMPHRACAEPVTLPIRIDYPLLQSLMLADLFTEPGSSLVLRDPADNCRQIRLADPRLALDNSRIQLEMAVNMTGGKTVGNRCLFPVQWEGYARVYAKPRLDRTNWRLRLDWQDSQLLTPEKQPAMVMEKLWQFFEDRVFDELNEPSLDLTPPVKELKPFLLSMAPEATQSRIRQFLDSLKPDDISIDPQSLTIRFSGEMAMPAEAPRQKPPEELSSEELASFTKTWKTWDAFLVTTMLAVAGDPLSPQERQILLDVLLETRYRFVEALSRKTHCQDFVRQQFLRAWKQLSPILRAHLNQSAPAADPWAYLAYFTASDALATLDQLGPALNIDISQDGLIRLARMLSSNNQLMLEYTPAVNPVLRELLGLGPPIETSGPIRDKDASDSHQKQGAGFTPARSLISCISGIFPPKPCRAATPADLPNLQEMQQWLVSRDNLDNHRNRVKAILKATVQKNLHKGKIPGKYQDLFEDLVYATAWQESCFRQFIVKNQKITFLKSYNNTSVGLMQIHERVWRGIYSLQHLRWNVGYNAEAGVEILGLYLTRYALPKKDTIKTLDRDGLAACLYAMYNGGPGQVYKFPERQKSGDFYISDTHFKEKYQWVKNGEWDRLKICLFGG
jgi:soluble lytic murein transglycosylase-like protein